VRVSFDSNYRASSGHPRRPAPRCSESSELHTLLLERPKGTSVRHRRSASIGEQAGSWGVQEVAIKRGDAGERWSGGEMWHQEPFEVRAVDPWGRRRLRCGLRGVPDQRWIAAGGTRPRNLLRRQSGRAPR